MIKEVEEFNEEVVLLVIRYLYWRLYRHDKEYQKKALGDVEGKEIFIYFSDGLGDKANRTAYFNVCGLRVAGLSGTQNKVTGFVDLYRQGTAYYVARAEGSPSKRRKLKLRNERQEVFLDRAQLKIFTGGQTCAVNIDPANLI